MSPKSVQRFWDNDMHKIKTKSASDDSDLTRCALNENGRALTRPSLLGEHPVRHPVTDCRPGALALPLPPEAQSYSRSPVKLSRSWKMLTKFR
ncbi:hypothetical protein EHI47_29925 [Rhizobium leguminosarum]|uniref:Uncharacterized protein n=2 Tax=Rhizobium TaxID=379 RepID=A0A444HNA3_RHILE|nr:hypothetical protein EHI47_29925 [Rhizobium leguminosarum]TAU45371.1 hypothetical protein ELI43_27835 [Rhizobium leguminosarum]TBC66469.1 hypothetical protein ELH27_28070 [Rhizobium leguminosarum]TBC88405.1 hypothetical protein ELH26_29435 [Rhizobium leguminosarum]TBE60746.1 hypothetical protein ELH03_28250 [Rhizobium beringeri]